jgi:hypothetical protein
MHAKLLMWLCCCGAIALAQDPFEIHVYEYEPMEWGEYSLETHLNFDPQGSSAADGTLLATRNQTHLTLEPTVGFAPEFALGFMALSAWEPGNSPEYGGWRVLPHFYAPKSWDLPVKLGFVAEFSFQNTRYEENSRRAELRPIVDREFTQWEMVFNPVFERALHGPGTRQGWNFEPAALVRWKRAVFSPSLEYYGEIESFNVTPRPAQVHQLFVGGDWLVQPKFLINMGLGFDVSGAGPGIVLKTRFEWHLGGKP